MGTPANLLANMPTTPALGVWVCTISGFCLLIKRYKIHNAFKSESGDMRRVKFTEYVLTPSFSPNFFNLFSSAEMAVTRSEEHTSELQSLMRISYAVFCLKKKKNKLTYIILQHNTTINTSRII